jgi:hypothetical protein
MWSANLIASGINGLKKYYIANLFIFELRLCLCGSNGTSSAIEVIGDTTDLPLTSGLKD